MKPALVALLLFGSSGLFAQTGGRPGDNNSEGPNKRPTTKPSQPDPGKTEPGKSRPDKSGTKTFTDNRLLNDFIREAAGKPEYVRGRNGYWIMRYRGMTLVVMSSPRHNRMRIITPCGDAASLKKEALLKMMRANFQSALDGRYAIFKGKVWATYLHPLRELTRGQFRAALSQVYSLRKTYGGAYSGGGLIFSGGKFPTGPREAKRARTLRKVKMLAP